MNSFKGGFGGANLQQLMKQAQKMQSDMENAKNQLAITDFKGSAGGSMVEVVMLGDKKVKSVKIKPEIVSDDDIEMLEDLVLSAVNDALKQIEETENKLLPNMPGM